MKFFYPVLLAFLAVCALFAVTLADEAATDNSLEQADRSYRSYRSYGTRRSRRTRRRCRVKCRAANSYEVRHGRLNPRLARRGYWLRYVQGNECQYETTLKWGWCHWYPECRGGSSSCRNVDRCDTEPSPGPGSDVSRRVEEAMDNLVKSGSSSVRSYGHHYRSRSRRHRQKKTCNKCEVRSKKCRRQVHVCSCSRSRRRSRRRYRNRY